MALWELGKMATRSCHAQTSRVGKNSLVTDFETLLLFKHLFPALSSVIQVPAVSCVKCVMLNTRLITRYQALR